jgi:hypothetical protein
MPFIISIVYNSLSKGVALILVFDLPFDVGLFIKVFFLIEYYSVLFLSLISYILATS